MSDQLSPENLGKELYILHKVETEGAEKEAAIANWNELAPHWRQEWETIAEKFCKYLKTAEADS